MKVTLRQQTLVNFINELSANIANVQYDIAVIDELVRGWREGMSEDKEELRRALLSLARSLEE
jgi:hypothetical protein